MWPLRMTGRVVALLAGIVALGLPTQPPVSASCSPAPIVVSVPPTGGTVEFMLPSCQPARLVVDPALLANLPAGRRLMVSYDPAPELPNEAAAGALGGGNVQPLGQPVELAVGVVSTASGAVVPLPPSVGSSLVELRLPVLVGALPSDTHFAWLLSVQESTEFLGYARLPAEFEPATNSLRYHVPLASLPGALLLPSRIVPAYVANHNRAVHIWSGPTSAAVDFGVAAPRFTVMRVVAPQVGRRIFVYNRYTNNYGWIDASGVGPVPGPK